MSVNKWMSDSFYIYISRRLELVNNMLFAKFNFFTIWLLNMKQIQFFVTEVVSCLKMAAHSLKQIFYMSSSEQTFIVLCSQCNIMKFSSEVWKRSMDL